MTPTPAIAPSIPATAPSRLRRFVPLGLIAIGLAMLLGLSVWLVSPHTLGPTVEWGWPTLASGNPDPTVTAHDATTIFVRFNEWPGCHPWDLPGDTSWLTPVITYTPTAVIITLRESEAYINRTPGQCGMYDTWGPEPIHLDQWLGDRTLYDGSVSPPVAEPLH